MIDVKITPDCQESRQINQALRRHEKEIEKKFGKFIYSARIMYTTHLPDELISVEDEALGNISFNHVKSFDFDKIAED
jgi:hypothetical protein